MVIVTVSQVECGIRLVSITFYSFFDLTYILHDTGLCFLIVLLAGSLALRVCVFVTLVNVCVHS